MKLLRGKRIIQLICMIAIAVTTVFHVDVSLASPRLDGVVSFSTSQNDDQGKGGKVAADLCHFCSCTAACADFLTPSPLNPGRKSVPAGKACSLAAYKLPATAPPPRS